MTSVIELQQKSAELRHAALRFQASANTLRSIVGSVTHIVCGNFVTPRALTVNNTAVSCAGSGVALPAARNGGWCMETTAGQYDYAYFNTY